MNLIGQSTKVDTVSLDIQRIEARMKTSIPQSSWTILNTQLESLQSFAIDSTRRLNDRISTISSCSGSLDKETLEVDLDQREKVVLKLISGLQGELSSLRVNYDAEAIKFGQLGFRSARECDAWIMTHYPGEDFGLLVDFHLVMEHFHVQLTGQKLIKILKRCIKWHSGITIRPLLRVFSTETRLW